MSQYQAQRTPNEFANSILRSLTATAKGEASSLFASLLTTGEPQITPAPELAEDLKALSAALTGLAGICDGEAKLLTVTGACGLQGRCEAPRNFPNALERIREFNQARWDWLLCNSTQAFHAAFVMS